MTRRMDRALINTLTVRLTQGTGSRINSMAKELRLGLITHATRGRIKMGRKMGRGCFCLLMAAFTLAFFIRMKFREVASTFGLTVRLTMENG